MNAEWVYLFSSGFLLNVKVPSQVYMVSHAANPLDSASFCKAVQMD